MNGGEEALKRKKWRKEKNISLGIWTRRICKNRLENRFRFFDCNVISSTVILLFTPKTKINLLSQTIDFFLYVVCLLWVNIFLFLRYIINDMINVFEKFFGIYKIEIGHKINEINSPVINS